MKPVRPADAAALRSVLVGCLLLPAAACGAAPPATEVGATDHCGEVETVPIQGEGHLVGDQDPPVPYNSTPPTSGWHTSGDVAFEVYGPGDALSEPEQVTVLELGGVVVSYHGLDEAEIDELAGLVASDHAGQAALTPYDELDEGQVALTAWGTLQLCDAVEPGAISAFIETYAEAAG